MAKQTINGDIELNGAVFGSAENIVFYSKQQTLTDIQKEQARENIDAVGADEFNINNNMISFAFTRLKTDLETFESNALRIDGEQTLTEVQKFNVLKNLGMADELVQLNITCDNPSDIIGVTVTVTYGDITRTFTWEGETLEFIIPMNLEYEISFSAVSRYTKPENISATSRRNYVRQLISSYDIASIDLSMTDINGNPMELRETANCYVIHETGYYEFPLVYGCAIMGGQENPDAYTYTDTGESTTQPFFNYLNNQIVSPYIETDTGINAETCEIVLNDSPNFIVSNIYLHVKQNKKYVRFNVTHMPERGGNVTLAVKDQTGTIMWSWHLWAYPFELTTKQYVNTNGFTYDLLDVNLGWVVDSVSDSIPSKYGTCPYYQWGRKDPMLRANMSSANVRTNASQGSFSAQACATSMATTIQNPTVFYKYAGNNYNWWKNDTSEVLFYNYWDADTNTTGCADNYIKKTVYDPCPAGFSIPNGNTFLGVSKTNGGTWDKGWIWSERYFPAVGLLDETKAVLYNVGKMGYAYLSATKSKYNIARLNFDDYSVNAQYGMYRAHGISVVPVALRPRS